MSIIRMEQLSRSYGRRIGVDAADLEIDEGEIFGFLGPNGAGKTTTIRILLGFLRPTRGRAQIFERDCWRESPRIKRDVGYLPGDVRLYPWLTARRALRIVGRVRGVDLTARGAELAERFCLEMNLRVQSMSRGTRQKLGLILALAHWPRLLILDEPTSGLDPNQIRGVRQTIRRLGQEKTILLSTHILQEVEAMASRVIVINEGRKVYDGTIEDIDPHHRGLDHVFADLTGHDPVTGVLVKKTDEEV
jgi:ABC-2 type transport system ATP-binding protein